MHVRVLPLVAAGALLALVALPKPQARAGEREWRDLRKTFDAALAAVDADRGKDAEASAKLREDLRGVAGASMTNLFASARLPYDPNHIDAAPLAPCSRTTNGNGTVGA